MTSTAPTDDGERPAPSGEDARLLALLGSRSIVLVGMMGAGKSSIGRRLAERLGLPFVDADHEIELAAGMSVSDIFAVHGEAGFRDGEARVIARLLDGGPVVLATGGGAFMREETRGRIKARGASIWLKAEPDVILRRVKRRNTRPLLQTGDPAATIAHLCDERYPVYAEADTTVMSRDVSHDKIVGECVEALLHWLDDPAKAGSLPHATMPQGAPG
jgi:shikimate kinase